MFTKNPYLLPGIGFIVLILLFVFQKQQQNQARELNKAKAIQMEKKGALPDSTALALFVNDPVFGTSDMDTVILNNEVAGRAFTTSQNNAIGRIETDIFGAGLTLHKPFMIVALVSEKETLTPQSLNQAPLRVEWNTATDSLIMTVGTLSGSSFLPKATLLPIHLEMEWNPKGFSLFICGKLAIKREGSVSLSADKNRWITGFSKENKEGVNLQSFKLYLKK